METLNEMRRDCEGIKDKMQALIDRSNNRSAEERGLTKEETEEFDVLESRFKRLQDTIDRAESLGNREGATSQRRSGYDDHRQFEGGPGPLEVRAYDRDTGEWEERTLRPDDPEYQLATTDYAAEFREFVRHGFENRALNITVGDQGGVYAPMAIADRFFEIVRDNNWLRQISNTVSVQGAGSLGVVGIDVDPDAAVWTSEISDTDASADTAMKFGRRELSPNLLIKRLDASRTMLQRLANAEGVVTQRLGYKVARTEEAAFLEGSGAGQPLGIFTPHESGIDTSRDVLSGVSGDLGADSFIEAQHELKAAYRRMAQWVMSREAVKRTRKLKDGENRYLWARGSDGLNGVQPDTLLGSPIRECELAPGHDATNDWDDGDYVAVYGDFNFYQIATAVNLQILRDNLSSAGKNKVRFFVYHEVDAMPILAEAFTRIKLGA